MSLLSNDEGKIFAKGVVGNVRKAQEDSHGWKKGTPNGDIFVVCDGMGGHVGGAMASRIAVESIIGYLERDLYSSPIEALDGALQFANMQILGYADSHPEYRGMGTTACIVLIQGDGVWIAHVGDSRIYLYLGKEKQLHRITRDHSYVQTLVDAGQITDEEAEHHPNKNRIMKALGIKPDLHPDFNFENKPIYPKNGDIFLICSDGLSGMIPDRTIGRVLGKNLTLQQKGDQLIKLAMQGETIQPGGQDNCTVELIEIDNSSYKTSEFKSHNPASAGESPRADNGKRGSIRSKTLVAAVAVAVLLALGVLAWVSLSKQPNQEAIDKAVADTASSFRKVKECEDGIEELNQKIERLNDSIGNIRKSSMEASLKEAALNKYEKEKVSMEAALKVKEKDLNAANEIHKTTVESLAKLQDKKNI